jgi:hypothetical protein
MRLGDRRGPGHQPAEGVPDQVHRALADLGGNGEQVVGQRRQAVVTLAIGPRGLVLAALIDRQCMPTVLGQWCEERDEVLFATRPARHEDDGGVRRRRARDEGGGLGPVGTYPHRTNTLR